MPDSPELTAWQSLQRSHWLAAVFITATCLGCVSLWVIDVQRLITLPAMLAVCGAGWVNLRRHAWLASTDAIVGLRWVGLDKLETRQRDGKAREYLIRRARVRGPLIVLQLKSTDRRKSRRSVVLMQDSMAPEALRQFRVWLRWRAS